jgi:hypothetical protein
MDVKYFRVDRETLDVCVKIPEITVAPTRLYDIAAPIIELGRSFGLSTDPRSSNMSENTFSEVMRGQRDGKEIVLAYSFELLLDGTPDTTNYSAIDLSVFAHKPEQKKGQALSRGVYTARCGTEDLVRRVVEDLKPAVQVAFL